MNWIGLPSARFHAGLAVAALSIAAGPALALSLGGLLLALLLVDLLAARRLRGLEVRVDAPPVLGQLERADCTVAIENRGALRLRLRLALDVPAALAGAESHAIRPVGVWAGTRRIERFALVARERGTHAIGALHLRVLGPLSLWWRQERRPLSLPVEVLPAFSRERRRRPAARMREPGPRADRRRGDHGEFESLREYVRGDDPRRLDWKATARRRALIVRNHQDERSQSVMLVVDAGRLMLDRVEGLPRIDWAVAAAAALADATRGWRDQVGLMVFSDAVHALLPPAQHPPDRIPRMLAAAAARPVEPDYPRALVTLARSLKRRSLVVLVSDVIDGEVSAPVAAHVRQLARRHLPLFVALRHPGLDAQAAAPVTDRLSLSRRAAATELLLARRKALESMRRAGIDVIDALPSSSLQAAVDHYVRIKRLGRL